MAQSGRCFIIAEVALAHDGSLGTAHAYIDAVARAGADAVKFQTHIAAAESSPSEPWRVKFSPQDATRYDYWQRTEFTEEQWAGLVQHAAARGLEFLSSPFSVEAAELLVRVGVRKWKVASGEMSNPLLLRYLLSTGFPLILSSGMSGIGELDRAVEQVRGAGADLTVLQCTSAYPCPPERLGLNLISVFRERYGCKVGLSDHSGKIYAALAAATLSADAIEVHVVFSRDCFGPDVPASVTIEELKQLVEGVHFVEQAMTREVDKDTAAQDTAHLRGIFTKSLAARRDLPEGTVLAESDLTARKPGTGIPAEKVDEVIGRTLKRAVAAGAFLSQDDFSAEWRTGAAAA